MRVYKRYLTLNRGPAHRLKDATEYSYNSNSFTASNLQRFILHDGTELLVQGDKISHVTLYSCFSWRGWLRSLFRMVTR